jgi:hypothetical protein
MRKKKMPGETGLSGKKLTILIVACLLVVGATLAYVLAAYSRLDRAREQTETAWRSVAALLDDRYRGVESRIFATESREQPGELSVILDQFRTSSQRRVQQSRAMQVESWLAANYAESTADAIHLPVAEPALTTAISELNQAQAQERSILESPGGRLLDLFLDFQRPEAFELARESSN